MRHTSRSLVFALLTAPLTQAQVWSERDAGELALTAEVTRGVGPLLSIQGTLGASGDVDLYVIHVDDPATFSASSVGGANFDSQMWMFDPRGFGRSFRDDESSGVLQSTLTGQFVTGPGSMILGISRFDNDPLSADGRELWNDSPFLVERRPDGPGSSERVASWSGESASADSSYTIQLSGASYAVSSDRSEPDIAWTLIDFRPFVGVFANRNYERTPTGQQVDVEKLSAGRFLVTLPGVQHGGVPHVSASGGSHVPQIEWFNSFAPDDPVQMIVGVYAAGGASVDAPFFVSYRGPGPMTEPVAMALTSNPRSPRITLDSRPSFNGDRGPITVIRSGIGIYKVIIPGLGNASRSAPIHVQVTSAGTGTGFRSFQSTSVVAWSIVGAEVNVDVLCTGANGMPEDRVFILTVHFGVAPMPAHRGSMAHLYANAGSGSSSYAAPRTWATSNGTAGPRNQMRIDRIGAGIYDVSLPSLDDDAHPMCLVSHVSLGGPTLLASVASINRGAVTGTRIRVNLHDLNGNPADGLFTLQCMTDAPAGAPAMTRVLGRGCGDLQLRALSRPVLGRPWILEVGGAPANANARWISFGLSNPNLPLDLIGAPGCFVRNDGLFVAMVSGGNPRFPLPVVADPAALGLQVFAQSGALAPSSNRIGLLTGNAVEGVLGDV